MQAMKNIFSYTLLGLLNLLVVLGVTSCAGATVKPPALPNFHLVAAGIYRGGAPTAEGLSTLKTMGIHTIIDLRISPHLVKQEKQRAQKLGFSWMNLPMGSEAPTQQQVASLLAVLARAPEEPVFVHCQHGADRAGCMIGIYRVTVFDWTFSQAWKEMRQYGFDPRWSKLTEAVRSRAKKE